MSDWHCSECRRATDHIVIDSRPLETAIRRRRECSICHHRLTTYEYPANNKKVAEAMSAPDDPFARGLWYIRKGLRLLDPGQDLRGARDRARETEAEESDEGDDHLKQYFCETHDRVYQCEDCFDELLAGAKPTADMVGSPSPSDSAATATHEDSAT